MIRIHQTKFGYPDGNCFAACVASIMECDISDVPLQSAVSDIEPLRHWLGRFELCEVTFELGDYRPSGLYVLTGLSPRSVVGLRAKHCVVARGSEILHDPHPDGGQVLTWDDATVIIPLDLSQWRLRGRRRARR